MIYINNGYQEKIDKDELINNNHASALALPEFSEFYDMSVKNLPFTRVELDDMPKIKYVDLQLDNIRSTRHYGQRKLLLSEIEFITLMYDKYKLLKKKKVILLYVGAAPGYHIPILVKMFPNLHFHLYDPANFAINEKDRFHIKIFQDFFTDKYIKKYRDNKNPVLFVSDIRDPFYDNTKSDQLQNDMRLQQEWVLRIKPYGAMFKFRLLFDDNYTKYLYGDSYLPVWGPLTTTETRLICNKDDTNNWTKFKNYSNRDHEERMMYFNNCYRMNLFNHNVEGVPGICHCYDCVSEIIILNNYLTLITPNIQITNITIRDMMINNSIITKRGLLDDNANLLDRKQHMRNRKNKSKALSKYKKYIKENFE